MSIYTTTTLDGLKRLNTSFRAEEAFISFYKEADYVPGRLRSQMTPVGVYLYCNGINISDTIVELPSYQGFNSMSKNIVKPAYVETSLGISALYVQEGFDLTWIAPGHPAMLAYVDYIDSSHVGKKSTHDGINANLDYVQTIVVRNLRRTNRRIQGAYGASVSYSLDFVGGDVNTLATGVMDL